MAELQPMFLTNLCYTAGEFRREIDGLVCGEGVSDGGSISDGTSLKVTTGGSGLNLSIAPGSGFIYGTNLAVVQGTYYVYTDAAATVLTAAAADATNPRIDRVTATVRDSDYGGTDDDWVLQILTGTPTVGANLTNRSGVADEPASSLTLAYVLVPAGFTGPFVNATHISDARSRFVACGDRQVQSTLFSRATTQSIGDNASSTTTVTFPVASTGTAQGDAWLTEASGLVTVKRTGMYTVVGSVVFAPNATGNRRAYVLLNGAGTGLSQILLAAPAANSTNVQVTGVLSVTAGQTLELACGQNSGGALNVNSASLSVTRTGTLVP